jgi:hypothetical protein
MQFLALIPNMPLFCSKSASEVKKNLQNLQKPNFLENLYLSPGAFMHLYACTIVATDVEERRVKISPLSELC